MYVYGLTPEVEGMFPKACEPVLGLLLDVIIERLCPQESEALLRGVGRRVAVLTSDHPGVCRMVGAMISELAGAPVREH